MTAAEVIDTPKSELAGVVQKEGLTLEKAHAIIETFAPLAADAASAIAAAKAMTFSDDPTDEEVAQATEGRKALADVRKRTEKARVSIKDDYLRMTKAIDGSSNLIKSRIEPEETRLLEVEQHAIRKEEARLAEVLAKRREVLIGLGANPDEYKLDTMNDAAFDQLVADRREINAAREKAAREAEEKRKADEAKRAEEDARIRAENEKLRREREAVEAQANRDREAAEAKARTEKAKADAKLREEREAREAAEAEAEQLRKAAEKKAADEAKARRRAANAPDKDKIAAIAAALRAITVPDFRSDDGKRVRGGIVAMIEQLATKIDRIAADMD